MSPPQPVGTTITWTALATDTNSGTLEYQFSVQRPGGDFAVVRDFSPSESFEWTPSEHEGVYTIRVKVRNDDTLEVAQLSASYSVSSLVAGSDPVINGTANPLVALYSAPACNAGSMRVRFWRAGDFSSQTTSWKSCQPGVSMNFYVAGMLADTQYQMRHEVSSDPAAPVTAGPTLSFTTGTPPAGSFPATSVVLAAPGATGQDVLLHSYLAVNSSPSLLSATNLSGQLLWYYGRSIAYATHPGDGGTLLVLLDNGRTLRELDLAGNTLRETNTQAASDQLLARGEQALLTFHHDARHLPDGKTLVLANVERTLSDVQGPGPVTIIGDMILVLDQNWQVTWTWNSFDHLDVTRKAILDEKCPPCATTAQQANDWLHSNSLTYSPADGNLLLSIRHLDWVIKVDYRDGSGTGDVLWRLGKDGDFTTDSADPYPWFSHQHDAEFELDAPDTITVFDNGNVRRLFPNATANSRGQVWKLDETNLTATLQVNADLGGYSSALGAAQKLSDGSYHFLSGFLSGRARSIGSNVDGTLNFILQTQSPTYRSFRMRDLYTPGPSSLAGDAEDQTINFGTVAAKTFGDAPFAVSATASSGLPVSFQVVSGPATVSGKTVTITGAGTVVLQADQYGNIKYNQAQSVRQSFAVAKASQAITFDALPDRTFGDPDFTVSATASSGLPVSFSAGDDCTVKAGKVHLSGAGSCTITATQAGDSNYNAAVVARTFVIARANQTINFAALTDKTFGNAPFALSANASSGLPVSFSVVSGPASLSNNTLTITGTGTVTVRASQAGDIDYNAAPNVERSFAVAKANQTITFDALPDRTFGDADFQLSAAASSGLAVSFVASGDCTVTGGVLHLTGTGTCTVTTSQAGDTNYNAAAVQRSFNIAKAAQTISVAALPGRTFGDPPFDLSATSSSGLPVNFNVLSGPASVSGSTLTLTGAGTVTVRASQPGNANYNAAAAVDRSFTVAKSGQTINFGPLADRTFGDTDFQLSATASSGLAVSFAAAGSCSVTGSTVHINGAGSCTVTASHAGDANYTAAAVVERSFQVAKAATATAVSSSANPAVYGLQLTFTATVTSAAGTPTGTVQFKADGANLAGPIALSAGGVAALTTSSLPAGTHAVTADYGGDTNFKAAAGALSVGQVVGASLEFTKATYAVGERDGSVTITVRRAGDTSQAVLVDYTTDDGSTPSVAVPCSSTTGLALERCDYTRAAGRLHFAVGEEEKRFVVLVNDDSFVEGAETLLLRLSAPSQGAALGAVSSATLEIMDDSPEAAGNPIDDDDETFVRQQYRDFLGREADADGLSFWVGGIKACGSDAGCREVTRIDTSAAFFLSIEFQETGYFAYRTYNVAFGDATSPGVEGTVPVVRLNDFLADSQRLGQGVIVNTPGWELRLADNKQAYALEFVQRPSFTNVFLPTLNAEEFVTKLDRNAGGVLSDAEKAQLTSTLGSTPGDASKRALVLRQVTENAVLRQRETDRAFVLMQFFGYLRRNPDDAPEKDLNFAGWKFWLDKLESFGGDYRRAEMVKAFITSDEYRQRFGR